jgi:nitric oxide dioxygenase
MDIDPSDVEVVRDSLSLIREHRTPASLNFYENLFALAPEMRALFRDSDLAGQGMRFMSTLTTIADLLDDPDALDGEIRGLARAHAALGVRAAHFAPMGSALMVTLDETLGPEFTPRLREAWRAAYDHFAAKMIAAGGFD